MTAKEGITSFNTAASVPQQTEDPDEIKKWEDLILLLDIVFAVIVCLGEDEKLTAMQMGITSLGLLGSRCICELIIVRKEGCGGHKHTAAKIASLLTYLALFANLGLATAIVMDELPVATVAWIMVGIELGTRILEQMAHRICGSNKRRYSQFQEKKVN